MTYKAMRLDERDVLIAIDELPDDQAVGVNQVDLRPYGGDCDRPMGQYRWNRDKQALEPLPRQQRAQAGRPTLDQAAAFDLLSRWQAKAELAEVSLAWLDDIILTHDFAGFVLEGNPLILAYARARGINLKKKV